MQGTLNSSQLFIILVVSICK